MPDWSKIQRKFTVDGKDYPTFREAQKALGGAQRQQNTEGLRAAAHAAAPHVAPEALDRIVTAVAEKYSFSDRSVLAARSRAAAQKRRAKKNEAPQQLQAPAVAA
jgi:hypothetical protein